MYLDKLFDEWVPTVLEQNEKLQQYMFILGIPRNFNRFTKDYFVVYEEYEYTVLKKLGEIVFPVKERAQRMVWACPRKPNDEDMDGKYLYRSTHEL